MKLNVFKSARWFVFSQKCLTVFLLVSLFFSDSSWFFLAAVLSPTQVAHAAAGDFAIFRETTGTETVVSSSTLDVGWDTTVQSNSNITLQGNNSDIDLGDGGKYFVAYNVWTEEGTSTAGTNRRSQHSWLTLGGTELPYGRGGGYLRDSDNTVYLYNSGAAIVDASAGDDLQVHIQRDDANTGAGLNVRPGTNGVTVLKLKDSWDYLRVYKTATSANISNDSTFTDVLWEASDEVDTDSFGFTATSGNVTLKGDNDDHFLVTANARLDRSSNNTRENYEMRLTLDGTEIPGTRVTAYLRGNNNGDGILNDTLAYVGLIKKDAVGDQTLNLEIRRESTNDGNNTVIMANQTAMSIVALPDEGSYVMLENSATSSGASSRTAMGFDTQVEVDSYAFSHSTTTNASRIEIDRAGDYLFLASAYAQVSSDDRQPFRIDWRKNGSTLLNYGSFGAFTRGNQSFSGGAAGALIMDGLTASDYIEITQFDETAAPVDLEFQADRVAVQGILLDSNFFGTDISVSATGTHIGEADIPETDVYAGGAFVINEQTSSRNVTSITITENGTVDGQTGLNNIELYYDLDTTSPYNCASESFTGTSTESQYGSTDTNGFSGANGVSSFSGSVAISTTQAMCVYVVYDVIASSSDSETVQITIANPANDVAGSGSPTVGPVTAVAPTGSSTLRNAELTQIHYNWRNDDGSETTATSIEGSEDTPAIGFANGTTRRLRYEVSAEGSTYSAGVVSILDDFSTGSTKTVSDGDERLLLVGIHSEDSSINVDINSVSYGGVAMTQIDDRQVTTVGSNGMWVGYLTESQLQSATTTSIVPSWNIGVPDTAVLYSSVVLENVDQISPISAWSSNTALNSTNVQPTTTLSTTAGDRTIFFSVSGSGGLTHSEPAGYTEGTEQDANGEVAANASRLIVFDGFEQPTTTYSGTANRLAMVALNVDASDNVSAPQQYRLEYAQKISTCDAATGWTDVGTGGAGDWDIVNTGNLTDGNNTTDISVATGGVTNENTTFFTPNGGQKDTSSQTGNSILSSSDFIELEYALEPTAGAPQGNTYCFRLTDAGTPLRNYDIYAEGTISADIDVSASSSQVTTVDVASTDQYVGGTFVIERAGGTRTVTDITITETGTVDGATDLNDIRLYYDLDTTTPYDCTGESYTGGEIQFGATSSAFSSANGSSTFSGSETVNSTRSMCVYVVLDVGNGATNGETINIEISDPSTEVVVTSSSVGPSTAVSPTGSTTVSGPVLTQTHYHWRNDNGDETDTGATSASLGSEDTAITQIPKESPRRLRLQVSNEGSVTSASTQYILEYGTKVTTCASVGSWTNVGEAGGAFDMSLSTHIADGNTTDIDNAANGAMTEENTTFVGTGALRETEATSSAITLTSSEYTELEYSIEATAESGFDTTYCFRVTAAGTALPAYTNYPELTTREKQDFFVQRGTEVITGTSTTLIAGVDYIVPSATSAAFIRITSSQQTGAGASVQGTQDADNVTAFIEDQSDITSEVVIARPSTATSDTRVDWEIVEYIGLPGADNEMIVRSVGTTTYGASALTASGTVVSGVSDDSDIVVFITGLQHPDAGTANYLGMQSTASWHATNSQAEFQRETSSGGASGVSYAVVEFTGLNWKVQRVEHNYSVSGSAETESIAAVNSISRAFVHAQKRTGDVADNGLNDYGQQVWLSSVGAVSFQLEPVGTGDETEHYAVAWIMENTQTGEGAMSVTRINGSVDANETIEPRTTSVSMGITLDNLANSSLLITNDSSGDGTAYPRAMLGATIASTTHFELYESDAGQTQQYRVAIVEWPVAQLAFQQNYYRFYVDNDALDPTDPWPVGASDLGENTSISGADDPLGEGERVRIRMSLTVNNALLPAEVQSFKLQFGRRDTACSAIDTWTDLGDPGSGAIWRGYNTSVADGTALATSTPAPGTLNISVSDVAGTFEEQNNTAINPYVADIGEDVEYDWIVEHNGATQLSDYCFRMVQADDTVFASYNNYPTLRTTGYTPIIANWRWYDDATSTTPTWSMAAENVAPTTVANDNEIKLRLTAAEVEGAPGTDIKFKLQYSESSDFSSGVFDVVSSTTCANQATTTSNLWCYADGGGIDNATITSSVLTDADSCLAGVGNGCGTYNEAATTTSTHDQPSLSNMEFEFTLRHDGARANGVYYFRIYDVTNDVPVAASSSYPSLVTEGASLVFTVSGINAGVITEGIITDATSTASAIAFGSIVLDTELEAAQRIIVDTNATEGYQILKYATQNLINSYAEPVPNVTGTNASPVGWSTGCLVSAIGCMGYHAGDDTLSATPTRFAADDSYAALHTTPQEIMYSSVPANESSDIVYKIEVTDQQPAGEYQTQIVYLAIPVF